MAEQDLISESDFAELWGAHVSESGDLFEFEEVAHLDRHRVWTIVEGEDDSWYALPGFHIVNKLGYCLTTKPWESGLEEALWFEDDGLE